jgi:enamine deaminase RidA (YjgF/YER057c/UK114 family)
MKLKLKYLTTLFIMSFYSTSYSQSTSSNPEVRLKDMGIELPAVEKPKSNIVKYVRSGNMIYLSGHGFCGAETPVDRGKVGKDLTVEQGYEAARRVGICLLGSLKDAVGDLNKVKRVVKVLGMVNSAPDFYEQHKVMNGFSDLITEVFGEKGKHARSAVGMASLPTNLSVEIEMIVEIEE